MIPVDTKITDAPPPPQQGGGEPPPQEKKRPWLVVRFFRFLLLVLSRLWLLIVFAGSLVGVYWYETMPKTEKPPLHLAFVGPMTGKSSANGISMERGVRLFLNKINDKGGIDGHQVVLDVYDDQNDADQAEEMAHRLIKDGQALAVIGHNYSSCSIRAGEVYQQQKIPAVSPTATAIEVTRDNPWYFRTIFNNETQGRFLANYVRKVLHHETVGILEEKSVHGSSLAGIFRETTEKIGGKVAFHEAFSREPEVVDAEVDRVVDLLLKGEEPEILFLSTHGPEGIKLIKRIKDAGILSALIGSDALASEEFIKEFNQHRKERIHTGYYTNGIKMTVPIIFDAASERVQAFYEEYKNHFSALPDWRAAFAYDAAMVLVHAMKNSRISGEAAHLTEDRQRIRDTLAALVLPEEAVEGVTGFNYFDAVGDTPKPIAVGVYKNQKIVSAPTQLQTIRDPKLLSELKKSYDEHLVVPIDDQFMFRTNIVNAGFKVMAIKNLDLLKQTFEMDFTIWFRFHGTIDTARILFINALEPVVLGAPLEEGHKDDITYRVYRTTGLFKADFMPHHVVFGRHILGFSFRHMDLSQDNLIFVTDVLGMGLTTQGAEVENIDSMRDLLSPDSGWSVSNIWMYQDIKQSWSLGNPKFLSSQKGGVQFSQFNFGFQIKPSAFTLRDVIPRPYAKYFMLFSLFGILFLARGSRHLAKKSR